MTDDREMPELIGGVVADEFVGVVGRYAYRPDYVVAPGETLRAWFGERGLDCTRWEKPGSAVENRAREARWMGSAYALAESCGIEADELAGLLAGTEPITSIVSLRLQEMTGVGAMFWLALEHNFREGLAAGKKWSGADE